MTAEEISRLEVQRDCDDRKSRLERNRLGQFATPGALARDILGFARLLHDPETKIRFLDPAFGTGAFYSALLDTFPASRICSSLGFEVDHHYGKPAEAIWRETGLRLRLEDFTNAEPDPSGLGFNLIICNPPYVRHHHLSGTQKKALQTAVAETVGLGLSGLAGLYCHFLLLSDRWLSPGGIAGWLVPSEFMDVNYGNVVKQYLLERVSLLRVHRFDPTEVQFDDALVSSAVVWFRKEAPSTAHSVEFSFGGSLSAPAFVSDIPANLLRRSAKWTGFPRLGGATNERRQEQSRLSALFDIKRGIATGNNKFFILNEERVAELGLSQRFLRPILPSPRYLTRDVIEGDEKGIPLLSPRLFLIDCHLPLEELQGVDPALARYLAEGEAEVGAAYLCKSRRIWYSQEIRAPAPFLCTYMGRGGNTRNAFRFIHNKSQAIAANVYLMMYPRGSFRKVIESSPAVMGRVLDFLNGLPSSSVTSEGRVYGGGLHKLEPRELANVGVDELLSFLGAIGPVVAHRQLELAI